MTKSFWEASDTLNSGRVRTLAIGGGLIYGAVLVGLNEAWYKDYERSSFHFFDDGGEWLDMDKMGHTLTAYFESEWIYGLSRWAGISENKSIWIGAGTASALQLTIEMLDAYSSDWGFSWKDVAANSAGAGLFAVQQSIWQEQRLRIKFSVHPVSHSTEPIFSSNDQASTTTKRRAEDLFGASWSERFLKDYNGQTYWLSLNPSSFINSGKRKKWDMVNIAFGIGAENLYGGFYNSWTEGSNSFILDDPRCYQYYLSLDLDLSRIRTNKPWLKTLLKTLNVIKIPFPSLEYSSKKGWDFHSLYF